MLRNAYGKKTRFIGDIAHKTEKLVREHAGSEGLDSLSKTVEFDADALKALSDRGASDSGKVINLAVMLGASTTRDGKEDPALVGIAERADAILTAFTERQMATADALERLKALMDERKALDDERQMSGLDQRTFAIFWTLRRGGIQTAEAMASEIETAFKRFQNYQSNADELRQLKAEIYRSLLREAKGKKMLDLAEEILRATRT
jgi:hypothetical protein